MKPKDLEKLKKDPERYAEYKKKRKEWRQKYLRELRMDAPKYEKHKKTTRASNRRYKEKLLKDPVRHEKYKEKHRISCKKNYYVFKKKQPSLFKQRLGRLQQNANIRYRKNINDPEFKEKLRIWRLTGRDGRKIWKRKNKYGEFHIVVEPLKQLSQEIRRNYETEYRINK